MRATGIVAAASAALVISATAPWSAAGHGRLLPAPGSSGFAGVHYPVRPIEVDRSSRGRLQQVPCGGVGSPIARCWVTRASRPSS